MRSMSCAHTRLTCQETPLLALLCRMPRNGDILRLIQGVQYCTTLRCRLLESELSNAGLAL